MFFMGSAGFHEGRSQSMSTLGVAVFDRERLSGIADAGGCGCSRRRSSFRSSKCNSTNAAANPASTQATITTKPVVLGDNCTLRVSACIAAGGGVVVHVVEAASEKVLATSSAVGQEERRKERSKLTREQSFLGVRQDDGSMEVEWFDKATAGALYGKQVRLRFLMRHAVLYGFGCESQ
jgi:hypothetical protein